MRIRSLVEKLIKKENIERKYYDSSFYRIDTTALLSGGFSVLHHVPPKERIYIHVGEKSILDCSVIFETAGGHVSVGANTYIGSGTNLISIESIEIGCDVMIAWGVTVYDHDGHSLIWEERKDDVKNTYEQRTAHSKIDLKDWSSVARAKIQIGNRCWIGFDAVILKGVILGDGVVVGARSVVTKSFPSNVVIAGNPARVVKSLSS
jgi:acetyltransferase-like isoleucine patch superfamily enzyme